MKPDLNIEELEKLMRLDATSGDLIWLVTRGKAKAGNQAGCLDGQGYRVVTVCGKLHMAHRVVWALHHRSWPTSQLDHRDLNKSNNHPANLRLATSSQNLANIRISKANTSGTKGVVWNKRCQKWQAQIKVNGRMRYLGLHSSVQDGAVAYAQAALAAWGTFARTSA